MKRGPGCAGEWGEKAAWGAEPGLTDTPTLDPETEVQGPGCHWALLGKGPGRLRPARV